MVNDQSGLLNLASMLLNQGGGGDVGTGLLNFATLMNQMNQNQQPEQRTPFPRIDQASMQQPQQPQQPSGYYPNLNTTAAADPNSSSSPLDFSSLQQAAETVFPNNPVLQKVAVIQAIQESGLADGKPSLLASKYNNLFGIKGSGTAGYVPLKTTEYVDGQPQRQTAQFAKNNSIADSFQHYRKTLNNGLYGAVLNAQNPLEAFQALQAAGYATDPNYANNLTRLYNQYYS